MPFLADANLRGTQSWLQPAFSRRSPAPQSTPRYNRSVSAPFRSYVLVSREQIARNFRNVCSVVGPHVEVAGVVKADAYGHGALEVARVLCGEGATGWP